MVQNSYLGQTCAPLVMILLVLQVLSAQSPCPCSSFSISYSPAGHMGSLCPVVCLYHHCFVGLPLDAWSPTSSKGASSVRVRDVLQVHHELSGRFF